MSEETSETTGISETQKLIMAVLGVIVVGIVWVWMGKQKPDAADLGAAASIRSYVAMNSMASEKCPQAIKKETKEQIYNPTKIDSDKETYITLQWDGENAGKGGFKHASCTLLGSLGGISELIIDGKVIISKKAQ